eukprot:c8366_g1_i2.p1 GENE.c8366_g1_i2~~c8366_g1_i2.p1  ORF type:complete len:117 (-),score=30.19 c8366_g1_i2:205-555(-)
MSFDSPASKIDPFAAVEEELHTTTQADYIHIRIQQRNGKKSLTTVQGLPAKYDLKRILKDIKKEFCCNGNIVELEPEGDEPPQHVIQLQGDQRQNAKDFFVRNKIVKEDVIKIHGY